jgi:hypothetical protein
MKTMGWVLFYTLLTLSVKQNRIRTAEMVYVNRQIKSMPEERTVLAPSRAGIIFCDLTLELTRPARAAFYQIGEIKHEKVAIAGSG